MTNRDETSYGSILLSINQVCLSFGDKVILRNVTQQVKDIVRTSCTQGQVLGILGPSGVGKTQLFRILAGLEKPTSGQVLLEVDQTPTNPGRVGVVAQNYPLFAHRTIFGNLMLAARRHGESYDLACTRVRGYLQDFGLLDKANSYPSELSGGQKQRIAVAQQMLCSAHFLLMDEPFSGLDLVNKDKVAHLVAKLASADTLNTIIITSHDIAMLAGVSDHLWLIGRDRDASGECIPGAYIRKVYDLVEKDLCWHPEIHKEPRFREFVEEVEQEFRTL